jgi:hypothetical protein
MTNLPQLILLLAMCSTTIPKLHEQGRRWDNPSGGDKYVPSQLLTRVSRSPDRIAQYQSSTSEMARMEQQGMR